MSDGVPRHIGRSPYSTSSISYMYIVRMDWLWIGEDWHSIGEGLMCHGLVNGSGLDWRIGCWIYELVDDWQTGTRLRLDWQIDLGFSGWKKYCRWPGLSLWTWTV